MLKFKLTLEKVDRNCRTDGGRANGDDGRWGRNCTSRLGKVGQRGDWPSRSCSMDSTSAQEKRSSRTEWSCYDPNSAKRIGR